mgnify:CR=1 FL=1
MDPAYITTYVWHEIEVTLGFLWLLPIVVIFFGGNFLMAHAILPSLIETRHLPAGATKLRIPFYLGAALGALGIVAVMFFVSNAARVIGEFYSRWWI